MGEILEPLFVDLVKRAIPASSSARCFWEGGNLRIDIVWKSADEGRSHTLKIYIMGEAIDAYLLSSPGAQEQANTRMEHYIARRFHDFLSPAEHHIEILGTLSQWTIMSKTLNG